MLSRLSQRLTRRLLPMLQLTRMALVFTAVSNAQCSLMLRQRQLFPDAARVPWPPARQVILMLLISVGLYGFGMSLNDIIDRRRDRQLASHRPIPSGRMPLTTAYFICTALGLTAILAGLDLYRLTPNGRISFGVLVLTLALVAFYDLAGKYLVALGLLSLGFIRFFHALVAAPGVPVLWHPLLLLDHVVILSAVAYRWEEKRPTLTRTHWWLVLASLAVINSVAIAAMDYKYAHAPASVELWIKREALLPLAAAALFILSGWHTWRTSPSPRAAGQTLMLTGLLWLIVYDTIFAAAYCGILQGLALLLLLPIAWLSVAVMRWWSRLMLLSQRPTFQRAETLPPESQP